MAVRFSAGNYFKTTSHLPSGTTYTFTCWIMLEADQNDYREVVSFGPGDRSLSTQADGTTLSLYGGGEFGSFPLTVGTWYRVGVVVDGVSSVIYFGNATGLMTPQSISSYSPIAPAPGALSVGGYEGSSGYEWPGLMANFKVFDGPLTQVQVVDELSTYSPVLTSSLVRLHPFRVDESDTSGNGSPLTTVGTPTFTVGPPELETGSTIELQGIASAASSAQGSLGRSRTVSGSGSAAAGAVGNLSRVRSLSGAAQAASDSTGSLLRSVDLSGHADTASLGSGALRVFYALRGTSDTASTNVGTLNRRRVFFGTSSNVSDAHGTLTTDITLILPLTLGSFVIERRYRLRDLDIDRLRVGELIVA